MDMGDKQKSPHIVITPSRNEAEFLPSMIESMAEQTHRPIAWIIVNHNSVDETSILENATKKHDWIHEVNISDGSNRRRGGQIAKLFNDGISTFEGSWSFCSKIDADMFLPEDYF